MSSTSFLLLAGDEMNMNKAVEFLQSIKDNEDIVVIFNNDGDGTCSAALLAKMLAGKIKKKKPFFISQPMPMDKNLVDRIKTTLPNRIIFLDLPVDQQLPILKKVQGICSILIIDHHRFIRDVSSKNTVHMNPRFSSKNIYQSTSYLTYKTCSKISDMSDSMWIAAVGMVSDYDLKDSQDVVAEIKKKYSIEQEKLYDTIFGRIADAISAVNATKAVNCENLVELFMKASGPEDIMANQHVINSYNEISSEMKNIMADFDHSAEHVGKTIFYNVKSKFNLRSPVSTKVSELYPDKIVIIYQKAGNKIKASMRNQSGNNDLTVLLKKAVSGLDAAAGGHERAAGAIVAAKDWETFKERMVVQ